MHRTQIYLPDEDYQRLLHLGQSRGQSLADLVRRAVQRYLAAESQTSAVEILQRTFGSWQPREGESSQLVRQLREEWSRREERFDTPD